jgi:hypothetical protein
MSTNPILATATLSSNAPLSQKVADAADQLRKGLEAAINAMDAPDADELFDIVLLTAAAFYTAAPMTKQMRRAVVARFDQCLQHQANRTTVNGRPVT